MKRIPFRFIRPLMLLLMATLTYASLNSAFAAELPILSITNDEDKDTTIFLLKTDEDGILITGFYKDTMSRKGKKTAREEFNTGDINDEGMILAKRGKHIVAKLLSPNFDAKHGGDIIIDTLYNGASGKRKQYEIQLSQRARGWVVTSKGKEINHMHMKSKKIFLIGTVGIESIKMIKK